MNDLEILDFSFPGAIEPPAFRPLLVGVVASGNLEVLMESEATNGCRFHIETSARGFRSIWEAVLVEFQREHDLRGIFMSINDMGATPAVVMLRLQQVTSQLGPER